MQNPFASSFPSPPQDEGSQAAHLHHPRALDLDQQQQQQQQQERLQQEQELELLHLSELDASQHHQQQQAFQLPHHVPHWSEHDDADSYSLASRTSSTGRGGGGSSNGGGGGWSVSGGTGAGGKAGGGGSSSSSSSSSTAAAGRTKKRNLSNPQTSRWLTCQVCRDSKTKWYVKQKIPWPFLLSFVYPFSYPTPSVVLLPFSIP